MTGIEKLWPELRRQLQRELPRSGWAWWEEHEPLLRGLGEDHLRALGSACCRTRTAGDARRAYLRRLPDGEQEAAFVAWQRSTWAALASTADRHAALMDALEDLGVRVLQTLGRVLLGVLGGVA